uniref:Uncharacterized protein n=1 Tax=Sphaerodactylus townsendi TaxID=933632 RepID=A0ACB8EUL7_9SAUR
MLPTEVEDLLGSDGTEFWTSPALYDEVNGNTELNDNTDFISQELEEGCPDFPSDAFPAPPPVSVDSAVT